MSIQIRNLSKRFGQFTALNDVSLDIDNGELVALLGPSGCGKTTLLRIIAGLESPDAGNVIVQGEDATQLAVQRRQVGFVFQHYALFRHMNVFDNVAFGLRVKPRKERPPEPEIKARVKQLLKLVQLDWLGDRFPNQLSGGQLQRIALARALAVEPRVLLLDEPFGALDAKVRKELRRWLRRLHDELHVTSVFVTHDQEEALEVADRVVVMNHGRIEQVGAPDAVYAHPANAFVYGFLGTVNRFHGRQSEGRFEGDGLRVPVAAAELHDGEAIAYARPHDLEIERYSPGAEGVVVDLVRQYSRGSSVLLELERQSAEVGEPIEVELSRREVDRLQLKLGETLVVRPRSLRVFPAQSAAQRAAQ
ncbi:MAG: sulfate/molybdate ABC transporter ATP-binding protein [Betaproteobacteria bacterium]